MTRHKKCARFSAWSSSGYATGCSGALGVLHRVGGRGPGRAFSAASAEWSGRWAGFAPTWQSTRPLLRLAAATAVVVAKAGGRARDSSAVAVACARRRSLGAAFPGGRTDDDVLSPFHPKPTQLFQITNIRITLKSFQIIAE